MERFSISYWRKNPRATRIRALFRRGSVCTVLVAAGCAQTEELEPSTASVVRGDASFDDASCTIGQCGGGGVSHTGGAGGIVHTGGVPPTGGVPQTGGRPSSGGAPQAGGRANTGGTSTGGTSTGGTSTGGKATGGTSTGGTSTGGTSTGGTSTGGTSTGGTSTGGTSTGGASSSCPNYTTDDACSRCICQRCATQVASCFSSSDSNKNQQCKQIQDCAEQEHCASTPCLCGPSDPLCLSMDGECASVIQTVVGSNNLQTIINASNDQNHPLYRANQIGMCSTNNCRSECGL